MYKIAIVILNYNGLEYLKKFLGVVIQNSARPDTMIVLADNGSTDGSTEWVEATYPELKIIRFDKNHGFAGGYNLALKNIEAEYFILLNSDIEVSENWLSAMVDFMDNNPDVASVQPKILSWHNKEMFEYAGASGGYIDKYGYTFCRGRIFNKIERDDGKYDDTAEVFWTSGACMLIRAKIWNECGGFDEDFFAHMEEVDLCWRLYNRGYKLFVIPTTAVYHVGGGTLAYNSTFKTYLNFRNNLFLLYKNLPEKKFKKTLLIRKTLDIIAALFFVFTFKMQHAAAVIKAHHHYYKNIPVLKKKRAFNLKITENKEIKEKVLNRSLVFEYYIKGIDTFDRLEKYFK